MASLSGEEPSLAEEEECLFMSQFGLQLASYYMQQWDSIIQLLVCNILDSS